MLKVKKKFCGKCLFSKNKIVSDSRKASILKYAEIKDNHFSCHEATIKGEDVVCRGFYEKRTSNMIRISGRLGAIKFVD